MNHTKHLGKILVTMAAFTLLLGCVSAEVREVRQLSIIHIDLQRTKDGSYDGDFTYGNYTYVVKVTVLNHKIERIDIINNRDTGPAKAAEGVIPRVIEQQKNDVDAVSGATTTSKALLKAIERALQKAL